MTAPNEAARKLAREIAWPHLDRLATDEPYFKGRVAAGDFDNTNAVQIAIAAIEKTTELAAQYFETLDMMSGIALMQPQGAAQDLRDGLHLKGSIDE